MAFCGVMVGLAAKPPPGSAAKLLLIRCELQTYSFRQVGLERPFSWYINLKPRLGADLCVIADQ